MSTATDAKPGFDRSIRAAYRTSCIRFFEPPDAAGIAALFFDLLQTSKLDAHSPARFLRRHSGGYVIVDLLFEMKTQLLVELAFR